MSEGHTLGYIQGVKGFIAIYYLAQNSVIVMLLLQQTKKLFMFRDYM